MLTSFARTGCLQNKNKFEFACIYLTIIVTNKIIAGITTSFLAQCRKMSKKKHHYRYKKKYDIVIVSRNGNMIKSMSMLAKELEISRISLIIILNNKEKIIVNIVSYLLEYNTHLCITRTLIF